jgi:hypothetical protein
MQTSRLFPVIALTALCASSLLVHAQDQDTPAQAAARAALMQKMAEMDNEESSTNMAAPEQPASATPPVMNSQTNNMSATLPAPAPAPMNAETNMPVATPAPSATMPAMAPMTNMPAASQTQWPMSMPQTNPPPIVNTPLPAPSVPAASGSPLTAPALPISASQQQELQALHQQYQANQISPVQYQEQRAKILAGQ